MKRIRVAVVVLTAACLIVGSAGASAAATKQLAPPKNVAASATSKTSVSVSFSPVQGANSYTVFVYLATGQSPRSFPNLLTTSTSIIGLSTCTSYRISVQAMSTARTVLSSVQSGKASVVTECNPALDPTFGPATSTSDGFTVQITNYDAAYTWSGSVTAGSVVIGGTGLATVSGLTTDDAQTLTLTTTRPGYATGAAAVAATRSQTPATPIRWIGAGDFTVELWVKPSVDWVGAGRQELFAIEPTDFTARLDIAYYENGTWQVIAYPWNTPPVSAEIPPPAAGQWTHVALTRGSNTMRLYVAGVKVAETSANQDFSLFNEMILGADPNYWCGCSRAQALLSNIRVIDGTALYTGDTLTVPTSPLVAVSGTTFLLNNALGDATVGSVGLNGSMWYQQGITTVASVPTLSAFSAYTWSGSASVPASVVTSADSPFPSG